MTWFKVDDKSAFHRKVLRAGNEAWGAFCRAGAVASSEGTDGRFTADTAAAIAPAKVWTRLVDAGLVDRVDGSTDLQIHDFLVYNPSAQQVQAKREARAIAGAAGGRRSGEARTKREANREAIASPIQSKSLPVASYAGEPPTRPDPDLTKAGSAPPQSQLERREPLAAGAAAAGANPAEVAVRDTLATSLRLRHLAGTDLPQRLAAHCREHGFTGRHSLAEVRTAIAEADAKLADLASAGEDVAPGRVVSLVVGCVKAGPRPERKQPAHGRRPWDRPVQPADGPSQSRVLDGPVAETFDDDASPFADPTPRRTA